MNAFDIIIRPILSEKSYKDIANKKKKISAKILFMIVLLITKLFREHIPLNE